MSNQKLSAKAGQLQIDFRTGHPIALDWFDTGHENAIGVTRLDEYIEAYQRHAEAKAADSNGDPAGEDTIGLLSRLIIESTPVLHIGKEVDRLDADRGSSLMTVLPVEYERDDLAESVAVLAMFPQKEISSTINISERAWRNILKGLAQPHGETARRIRMLGAKRSTE
jgi:hypothetical protein